MNNSAKLVSLLFCSDEPISVGQLELTLELTSSELIELARQTNQELNRLGLGIIAHKSSLQLTTTKDYAKLIKEFYQTSPQPLSQAVLEVLSVIAYRQPISKGQIDEVRGVSSDKSIASLISKGLVKKISIKNEIQYTTTSEFLKIVGIKSLEELEKPR